MCVIHIYLKTFGVPATSNVVVSVKSLLTKVAAAIIPNDLGLNLKKLVKWQREGSKFSEK